MRLSNKEIFAKYDECTICLAKLLPKQKVMILDRCQHVFHESCCRDWLDYRFKCPNCNQDLFGEEEEEKEENEEGGESSRSSSRSIDHEELRRTLSERRDAIEADEELLLNANTLRQE